MKTNQEILKEEINIFKDEIISSVRDSFMEHKSLDPIMFAMKHNDDKKALYVLEGLESLTNDTEEIKRFMKLAISQFNETIKPIVIGFASEGFLKTYNPLLDENGKVIEGLLPLATEIEAERKEVVFINFETYNQESSIFWEIIRDKEGSIIDLKLLLEKNWQPKNINNEFELAYMLTENYETVANEVNKYMSQNFNMN